MPTFKPKDIRTLFRWRPEEEPPCDPPPPRSSEVEKVTSEELRNLHELLHQRYALDLEIWRVRKVAIHNMPLVEDRMKKADALLVQIRAMVLSMDHPDRFRTDAEYQKLTEIKLRVLASGKREWIANPPWDED